jgi:plasmid maintenance system antidote protein VapI
MKSSAKTIIRDPRWLGPAIHPGEMLKEEFLSPLGLRLARRFKTTPRFWMHLQADWDLHQALKKTSVA